MMITAAEKQELVEWVKNLEDEYILQQLKMLRNTEKEEIEHSLTKNLIESINRGLDDVKNGRVFTHEQAMEKMKEKFPNLFNK
jgi:HEPN domain-containing protein